MMGKSLFEFMDDAWRQAAMRHADDRRPDRPEQHDFKFRRKDGG